jgi:hypothetical protein
MRALCEKELRNRLYHTYAPLPDMKVLSRNEGPRFGLAHEEEK